MAQNDKNIVTEDKVTFRLCDDCLGVNLKTLIPKLKKKAPNAEFIIRMSILLWTWKNSNIYPCK